MKKVIIFGSAGSVGRNALDVIARYPSKLSVKGLCTYQNIKLLRRQIEKFRPRYVCIVDSGQADKLKPFIPKKVKLFSGKAGLEEFCKLSSDVSLMAISGISCLRPLLEHIPYAKQIGMANKESIVTAGSFVFDKACRYKTEIIPVDSEINALFQLFRPGNEMIERVCITASGGALRKCTKKKIANIKINDVLSHPTWSMGKRITVDSATLVNKGFEVIETHYFFGMPYEKIDVVIHPESVVHAMVQSRDKAFMACMYPPDMRIPISYALFYPDVVKTTAGIDLKKPFNLHFEPVDYKQFPLLKLMLGIARRADNGLAVLNACDEIAIDYFLRGRVKFSSLYKVLGHFSRTYPRHRIVKLEDVLYWDDWGRRKTVEYLNSM